jgi:hypothetical protein
MRKVRVVEAQAIGDGKMKRPSTCRGCRCLQRYPGQKFQYDCDHFYKIDSVKGVPLGTCPKPLTWGEHGSTPWPSWVTVPNVVLDRRMP